MTKSKNNGIILLSAFILAIFMLLMVGKINVNAKTEDPFVDIGGDNLYSDDYTDLVYSADIPEGVSGKITAELSKISPSAGEDDYIDIDSTKQFFQYIKDMEIVSSKGVKVAKSSPKTDNYRSYLTYEWTIDSADTYIFSIYVDRAALRNSNLIPKTKYVHCKLKLTYSTGKYESFTVEKVNLSNGGVQYDLGVTDFDGSDSSQTWFLREDRDAKTIKLLAKSYDDNCNTSDVEPPWGTNITYYAIKENILKANIPSLYNATSTIAMTSTIKNALVKYANSVDVTTPAPGVGSAVSLKATPGIKSANLEWRGSTKNDVTYISGYQVKRYNSAGQNDATYTVADSGQYSNVLKAPIPYEGTYYFTVKPYYTFKGKTYWGAESGKVACASAKIYSPACLATKISNKVAKVTVNVPEGANGTIIYQNVGGKWKEVGKTAYSKKFTVKKNTAGKRQYRLVSYVTDAGKTYYAAPGKATKPQSNVCTCNYPKYAGGYPSLSHFWRPIKFSYSGNKVVVKGRFINTHIYTMRYFNIKLTVKAEGKVIGTKTIKCGRIKSKGTKVVTVKLDKSKKNMDLRNGSLYWSYKVVRADN